MRDDFYDVEYDYDGDGILDDYELSELEHDNYLDELDSDDEEGDDYYYSSEISQSTRNSYAYKNNYRSTNSARTKDKISDAVIIIVLVALLFSGLIEREIIYSMLGVTMKEVGELLSFIIWIFLSGLTTLGVTKLVEQI